MSGDLVAEKLQVMEATKNALVHIISGQDNIKEENLPNNVIGFLKKPVDIKTIYKTLATIENNVQENAQTLLIVGECGNENFDNFSKLGQLKVMKELTVQSALSLLKDEPVGCMVVDKLLYATENAAFLRLFSEHKNTPVIIYSDQVLSDAEMQTFGSLSNTIVLKSPKSINRLKDEISLFLHQLNHKSDDELTDLPSSENVNLLKGKRFLVVDDDERNIFAMKSLLETFDVQVDIAENGQESIDFIAAGQHVDIILMDIMMPKVDGYQAIEKIRHLPKGKDVPIIVLTAKAMQNERLKCLEIGANDYITKPIDTEKLLSVLKVWLA
ncbi:response regulator [Psychromonas sp. MME1]